MAKNDAVLIDGILDDRVSHRLPSCERDEVFEFFVFEQILRDADLSSEDILSGAIDGRDDGGIDGFFILINGHLFSDPESFPWPKTGSELDIWIITCKHHDTFKQAPMDNLVASISELFDLGVADALLKGSYSEKLIKCRNLLLYAYRKLSPQIRRFAVHFVYASRGDASIVGSSIVARSVQAVEKARELFRNCDASFDFIGATELINLSRKVRQYALELKFVESLTHENRYVLLSSLQDFYSFVTDEDSKLRRYLFDSNVRAFMGLNRVNEDIRKTLDDRDSPDFWWLNNGITILASFATIIGKSIKLEGVQIVNGLQTTESISQFFGEGGSDPNGRAILVKIIVSNDLAIRDSIIQATNNQTTVQIASLHATDKIQRDIEDILLRHGLYYERRTNFYAIQGIPATEIVTPLYLASGYVTLVLKSPRSGLKFKSKYMQIEEIYSKVFSSDAPLEVWPIIARIMKLTDSFLSEARTFGLFDSGSNFFKNWRQIVALIAVARIFRSFAFTQFQLTKYDLSSLKEELFESTWEFIKSQDALPVKNPQSAKYIVAICQEAAKYFSLEGVQIVEKEIIKDNIFTIRPHSDLPYQFVERVNFLLPDQPWKPRVHVEIAKQLTCHPILVSQAIQALIANKKRFVQKNGIVYGHDGAIIARDEERLGKS